MTAALHLSGESGDEQLPEVTQKENNIYSMGGSLTEEPLLPVQHGEAIRHLSREAELRWKTKNTGCLIPLYAEPLALAIPVSD